MEPVVFIIGEESQPKIEKLDQINGSLLKEQYQQSFKVINAYLKGWWGAHSETFPQKGSESYRKKEDRKQIGGENPNNIFAFIGERGSGKTSCMLSVANMLATEDKKEFEKLTIETKLIVEKKFHLIDVVDPSFFDTKHNILEIVIAKLFKKFNDNAKERGCDHQGDYIGKKHKLIDDFQKTKEDLSQMLSENNFSEDSLEQLQGLAAAIELRDSMKSLIDSYLKYFGNEEDILVIAVDDIDLHTQHAYSMVEQIRKYLIHPNVIILISLKIKQLATIMKLQYAKEFKELFDTPHLSMSTILEMVERYIGKLIPLGQRIFLPESPDYLNRQLIIVNDDETKTRMEFPSVKEAVPMLIFEKTRYLFYNSKGAISYIVPRNLRELRHLVQLLFKMERYGAEFSMEERPLYNTVAFKKYFFETWTANNLNDKGRDIIKNLLNITDAVIFNKSVIHSLKGHFPDITKNFDDIKQGNELSYIFHENTMTYNISIGDAMAVIQHIEKVIFNVFDQKLLFAIKSLYSLKLYEYFVQTISKCLIEETKTNKIEERKTDGIIKIDHMSDYSNYEKLVGGNFINASAIDIIPPTRFGKSRAQRPINAEKISNLLDLLNVLDRIPSSSTQVTLHSFRQQLSQSDQSSLGRNTLLLDQLSSTNPKITIDEIRTKALNIIEFFALTTSRKFDSKGGSTDKLYRSNVGVYYGENLSSQKKNLWFDIASIFYNIPTIKKAYDRFSIDLHAIAERDENSLLKQLRKCEKIYGKLNNEDANFLSLMAIRNAEMLEELATHLQQKRPEGKGDDQEVLKDFFNVAGSFKIRTYDKYEEDWSDKKGEKHSKGKNHEISFDYMEVISKIVGEMNTDIFNEIYNSLPKSIDMNDIITEILQWKGNRYKGDTILKMIKKYPDTAITDQFEEVFAKNMFYAKDEIIWTLTKINENLNG